MQEINYQKYKMYKEFDSLTEHLSKDIARSVDSVSGNSDIGYMQSEIKAIKQDLKVVIEKHRKLNQERKDNL